MLLVKLIWSHERQTGRKEIGVMVECQSRPVRHLFLWLRHSMILLEFLPDFQVVETAVRKYSCLCLSLVSDHCE
jgi:hypothetical protein